MDRAGLALVRIALPAAIAIAGAALLVFGVPRLRVPASCCSAWPPSWCSANLFIRLSLLSERDREEEQERRRFFSRRGRWPDERPR